MHSAKGKVLALLLWHRYTFTYLENRRSAIQYNSPAMKFVEMSSYFFINILFLFGSCVIEATASQSIL